MSSNWPTNKLVTVLVDITSSCAHILTELFVFFFLYPHVFLSRVKNNVEEPQDTERVIQVPKVAPATAGVRLRHSVPPGAGKQVARLPQSAAGTGGFSPSQGHHSGSSQGCIQARSLRRGAGGHSTSRGLGAVEERESSEQGLLRSTPTAAHFSRRICHERTQDLVAWDGTTETDLAGSPRRPHGHRGDQGHHSTDLLVDRNGPRSRGVGRTVSGVSAKQQVQTCGGQATGFLHPKTHHTRGSVRGGSDRTMCGWEPLPRSHRLCHRLPIRLEEEDICSTGHHSVPEGEMGPVRVPGGPGE